MPSVPTSLKEAMAFVNTQDSLSTEDLFKTLLMCHDREPKMSWFESFFYNRDKQFLIEAINKKSSQGSVSVETQKRIALGIRCREFGTPIPLALVSKLDTFTEPEAQKDIFSAICDGILGAPIPEDVALAIASKLHIFTGSDAELNISLAICSGMFGAPIPSDVALALFSKLGTFTDEAAIQNIALAFRSGIFGYDPELLKPVASQLHMKAHQQIVDAIGSLVWTVEIEQGPFDSLSPIPPSPPSKIPNADTYLRRKRIHEPNTPVGPPSIVK